MKICSKCKEVKEDSEFYKRKGNKSGLSSACKSCEKKRNTLWCSKNKSAYGGKYSKVVASLKAKRQNFIAKYGKDVDDIINGEHEERHDLSEFFD